MSGDAEELLRNMAVDAAIAAAASEGNPRCAAHLRAIEAACREELERLSLGEAITGARPSALAHRLLARALVLADNGETKTVEHGLVKARTELELEHNRELHVAHVEALQRWRECLSPGVQAAWRARLRRFGDLKRAE